MHILKQSRTFLVLRRLSKEITLCSFLKANAKLNAYATGYLFLNTVYETSPIFGHKYGV